MTDDHDYKPYLDAVKQGFLKESDIDVAADAPLYRAHEAGHVRSAGDGALHQDRRELLDSAAHRALARKIANESMVLLKNDGVLPLKTSGIKIAVVGPLADQTKVLLGNYNGTPTHTVSILEGLRRSFPTQPSTTFQARSFSVKRCCSGSRRAAHHRRQAGREGHLRQAGYVAT